MRLLLPLIVPLFLPVLAVSQPFCSENDALLNEKTCVKVINERFQYAEALLMCRSVPGGDFVSIHNAIDNRALVKLATLAGITDPFWLGLHCSLDRNTSACEWTDGSGSTKNYNNFVTGQPSLDQGDYAYFIMAGQSIGKWASVGTNGPLMYIICEYPSSTTPPSPCEFSFGDYCYTPYFEQMHEQEARDLCRLNCGDLVSIHSERENDFIRALFANSSVAYTRIGGRLANNGQTKYWVDGSSWDFDKTGFLGVNECMAMAVKDDIVPAGQWITSDCERTQLDFVCKTEKNVFCGPTPSPTLAPSQCNGTIFGDSHNYSPNYPYSYIGLGAPCTYVFSSPMNTISQLEFTEFLLDSKSSISIYGQIEDTVPMVVLRKDTPPFIFFNATGNQMKMVFSPCLENCESEVYRWKTFHTYMNG